MKYKKQILQELLPDTWSEESLELLYLKEQYEIPPFNYSELQEWIKERAARNPSPKPIIKESVFSKFLKIFTNHKT